MSDADVAVASEPTASEFEIAIQIPNGDVVKWAALHLSSPAVSSSVYNPQPAGDVVPEGCIGVLDAFGFTCHTLFRNNGEREALHVIVGGDGTLEQVQLVDGAKSEVFFSSPDLVPRPLLKPPVRTAAAPRGQAEKRSSEADADEETEEKSFVEKYWMYAIPIAIIAITNSFAPSSAPATAEA